MGKKKSKSPKRKKAILSNGNNIIVVAETNVGYFQEKVNSLLAEGYEVIWSTYRHPKENGYFCVVMISPATRKSKSKKAKKEVAENTMLEDNDSDDDSDESDNEDD